MSMCTIMNGIYLKVSEKLEACDVHVHHHEWNLPEGDREAGGM